MTKHPEMNDNKEAFLFSFQKIKTGYYQINFRSLETTFNCEPGQNNIYSAIYFYLREVRKRFPEE